MSKAQLVITAVVVEGRSKSAVARDYDLSRQWVHQLPHRCATEGAAAFDVVQELAESLLQLPAMVVPALAAIRRRRPRWSRSCRALGLIGGLTFRLLMAPESSPG